MQLNRWQTAESSNPKTTYSIKLHIEEGRAEVEEKKTQLQIMF